MPAKKSIRILYENIYNRDYLYDLVPRVVETFGSKLGFDVKADVVENLELSLIDFENEINPQNYNIIVMHIGCESDKSLIRKAESLRRIAPGKIVAESSIYPSPRLQENMKWFIENYVDAYVGPIKNSKNFEKMLKDLEFL